MLPANQTDALPRFMTINDVAERLSVHRSTVLRMCEEGILALKELPGASTRPILRITVDSFQRYANSAFSRKGDGEL